MTMSFVVAVVDDEVSTFSLDSFSLSCRTLFIFYARVNCFVTRVNGGNNNKKYEKFNLIAGRRINEAA